MTSLNDEFEWFKIKFEAMYEDGNITNLFSEFDIAVAYAVSKIYEDMQEGKRGEWFTAEDVAEYIQKNIGDIDSLERGNGNGN